VEETKKLKDRIQKLLPSYATAVECNSNKNNTGNTTTDTDRTTKNKKRKSFSSVVTANDTEVESSGQNQQKVEEPWDRDLVISYSICFLLFVLLFSWFLFPSNGGIASSWRSFY
jgi:hypothetical protein